MRGRCASRGCSSRTPCCGFISRSIAVSAATGPLRCCGVEDEHMSTTSSTTHYPAATVHENVESHTLSVIVDNEPGVLARVIGLFSGRGYNIESLTVSETEHQKHLSRITIVTRGTPMVIEQIKNQLDRMVPVHRVVDM